MKTVKYFDSNYHYVKPTLQDGQKFKLAANPKPVVEYLEVREFRDFFEGFLGRETTC